MEINEATKTDEVPPKAEVVEQEYIPTATDLSRVSADSNKDLEGAFIYDDGKGKIRYPFIYHKVPWKRSNQLRGQAMSEVENQDLEERRFQELYMIESIKSVTGQDFKDWAEYQMDSDFGEAFRVWLFKNNGITRVPQAVVEKLIEELKPYIDSQISPTKGQRKKKFMN